MLEGSRRAPQQIQIAMEERRWHSLTVSKLIACDSNTENINMHDIQVLLRGYPVYSNSAFAQ
jgi:hypothetical protein